MDGADSGASVVKRRSCDSTRQSDGNVDARPWLTRLMMKACDGSHVKRCYCSGKRREIRLVETMCGAEAPPHPRS